MTKWCSIFFRHSMWHRCRWIERDKNGEVSSRTYRSLVGCNRRTARVQQFCPKKMDMQGHTIARVSLSTSYEQTRLLFVLHDLLSHIVYRFTLSPPFRVLSSFKFSGMGHRHTLNTHTQKKIHGHTIARVHMSLSPPPSDEAVLFSPP